MPGVILDGRANSRAIDENSRGEEIRVMRFGSMPAERTSRVLDSFGGYASDRKTIGRPLPDPRNAFANFNFVGAAPAILTRYLDRAVISDRVISDRTYLRTRCVRIYIRVPFARTARRDVT